MPNHVDALGIGLRNGVHVLEHCVGVGAVVQQGCHHHGAATGFRQRLQERHGHLSAFGDHVDATPMASHGKGELHHFFITGQTRGHGKTTLPVVRGAGAGGKTHGASGHGLFDDIGHGINFFGRGLTLIRLLAHHPSANRGVTNVGRDIDGATLLFEHGHVLGKSFKAPINAIAQHIQRHAFDLREVTHGEFAVLRPTRRNGETAIANHGGGHAHGG